jgi:uncharacterized protein (TIGR03435 family)
MLDFSSSGPALRLIGYPIKGLVMEAYALKNDQVVFAHGVPLFEDTYYDITAKASEGSPTRAEFRQLLQGLLGERFKLRVHRETRDMPVYALVVSRNGAKFKESAQDATSRVTHGINGPNHTLTASRFTMADLAREIEGYFFVDRPVIDRSGLSGAYDISIEAAPYYRDGNLDSNAIGIFTAVQEQLGLKLERQNAPIHFLVIDHVEAASAN